MDVGVLMVHWRRPLKIGLILGLCFFSEACTRISSRFRATSEDTSTVTPTQQEEVSTSLQSFGATFDPDSNTVSYAPDALKIDATGNILQRFAYTGASAKLHGGLDVPRVSNDSSVEWLVSLSNSTGKVLNHFQLASAGGNVSGFTTHAFSDGSVVISGWFNGSSLVIKNKSGAILATFTSGGMKDAFLVKVNTEGEAIAATQIASSGDDTVDSSVRYDQSLGKYFTLLNYGGSARIFHSSSAASQSIASNGSNDILLLELDGQLQTTWGARMGGTNMEYRSGLAVSTAHDRAVAIVQTLSVASFDVTDLQGNTLVANNPSFAYTSNAFVLSLNLATHSLEWARAFVHQSAGFDSFIYHDTILRDEFFAPNGDFILSLATGFTTGSNRTINLIDLSGNQLYTFDTKNLGFNSNLFRFNASGDRIWHRQMYGPMDTTYMCFTWTPSFRVLSDGSITLVGKTELAGSNATATGSVIFTFNGVDDYTLTHGIAGQTAENYVARFNANGSLAWARILSGTKASSTKLSSYLSETGVIYYSGEYNSVPFEVRSSNSTLATAGFSGSGTNGIALKIDASGTPGWIYSLTSATNASLTLSVNDANGSVALRGFSNGDGSFRDINGTSLSNIAIGAGESESLLLASFDKTTGNNLKFSRLAATAFSSISQRLPNTGSISSGAVFTGALSVYNSVGEKTTVASGGGKDAVVLNDLSSPATAEVFSSDADDYLYLPEVSTSRLGYYYYSKGATNLMNGEALPEVGPLYFHILTP